MWLLIITTLLHHIGLYLYQVAHSVLKACRRSCYAQSDNFKIMLQLPLVTRCIQNQVFSCLRCSASCVQENRIHVAIQTTLPWTSKFNVKLWSPLGILVNQRTNSCYSLQLLKDKHIWLEKESMVSHTSDGTVWKKARNMMHELCNEALPLC